MSENISRSSIFRNQIKNMKKNSESESKHETKLAPNRRRLNEMETKKSSNIGKEPGE